MLEVIVLDVVLRYRGVETYRTVELTRVEGAKVENAAELVNVSATREGEVLETTEELLGFATTAVVNVPEVCTADADEAPGVVKAVDEAMEEVETGVWLGRPAVATPKAKVAVPLGPGLFMKPDFANITENEILE